MRRAFPPWLVVVALLAAGPQGCECQNGDATVIDHPDADPIPLALFDGGAGVDAPVWGFADLHAHPAMHLGFGGDETGTGGLVWGLPGRRPVGDDVLRPAASCDGETHLVGTTDVVQRLTQQIALGLTGGNGHAHAPMWRTPEPGEPPDAWALWPSGREIYHQNMSIDAIHRAWRGGLRLMFASVTDNQTLSQFMHITLAPAPLVYDVDADVGSVERQLRYIIAMARDNADWMEIVTSPSQARRVIGEGRLALVLSIEVDYVPIEDMQRLYRDYGVRHTVPIHLADNPTGGTAVYDDIFNTHSALYARTYTGSEVLSFEQIQEDPLIQFRFDQLLKLEYTAGLILLPQKSQCGPFEHGYVTTGGHRNARGLVDSGYLRELMRLGMFLDISHMGTDSANGTIEEAGRIAYPVMDTHTGVALDDSLARQNERDITFAQAQAIAASHGVIGLGTGGDIDNIPTRHMTDCAGCTAPLRWTFPARSDGAPTTEHPAPPDGGMPPCPTPAPLVWTPQSPNGHPLALLRVTVAGTAADNFSNTLRGASATTGGTDVRAIVTSPETPERAVVDLNGWGTWGNGFTVSGFVIAHGICADATTHVDVAFEANNLQEHDVQFDVDAIRVDCLADPVVMWAEHYEALARRLDAFAGPEGASMAIGTDINGLAPQIEANDVEPLREFDANGVRVSLGHAHLQVEHPETRALVDVVFQQRGIGTYGMLPELMGAVANVPVDAGIDSGVDASVVDRVYRSAEAVVEQWERQERAACVAFGGGAPGCNLDAVLDAGVPMDAAPPFDAGVPDGGVGD